MKKYSWLSSLFLLILSGIAISVRIYYINNLMSEISINEEIYFAAKVNVGNTSFSTIFSDGLVFYVFNIWKFYSGSSLPKYSISGIDSYFGIFYGENCDKQIH